MDSISPSTNSASEFDSSQYVPSMRDHCQDSSHKNSGHRFALLSLQRCSWCHSVPAQLKIDGYVSFNSYR